jgi:octaprenyl-diphosphate synthase
MLAAETKRFDETRSITIPDPAAMWSHVAEPVQFFLSATADRLSNQVDAFEPEIAEYARYALTAQGKQLRPLLVAHSAGASGEVRDSHVTVAVIIEMVHLATLVHDDLMDEARIRRGRPTLAANWGNDISVLLGDCLFAHALKLAAEFPTPEICRAVAHATNTVCSGEILQTQGRRNFQISRGEYFRILSMKTAELFSLSCGLGAMLSGAGETDRDALELYGRKFGIAYQIYDDCLDLCGSERLVGKSLGTDLAKGKLTLPLILAIERCEPAERRELERFLGDWQPSFFQRVLELLGKYRALEDARGIVHDYLDESREALRDLPVSASRDSLFSLAGFLSQQTEALGVVP